MRKICKRIGTIVIAMSVFICSSLFAFAAEDEHYHNFMKCQQDGGEYKESVGPHTYLYGTDHNGKEIYRNDCQLDAIYVNCIYVCDVKFCTAVEPGGGKHRHFVRFKHSKSHP